MSAWIVSNKHLSAILGAYDQSRRRFGQRDALDEERAVELGQLLLDENHRSVNHRYDTDEHGRFRLLKTVYRTPPEPLAALKLCMSLDYQSCENDDWNRSAAFYQLRSIIDSLIAVLPGYDAAAWCV
jgi:hypothetical protein